MQFKQWQNDQSPRHQLDSVAQSDPYSLVDKNLPKVTVSPENLDLIQFNHCLVLPSSLKWLLPKSIINLTHIGVISGTLQNDNNTDPQSMKIVSGMYDTEDSITRSSTEEFLMNYNLWKLQDTVIVIIEENEMKYPTIVTNFMTRQLAQLIGNVCERTILVNSDRLTELKTLTDLIPPEFITGSITNLILSLKDKSAKVLVVPAEGPSGFEKYNFNVVDSLVDEMSKLLCSYPSQTDYYVSECIKLWKLDGCTTTQGGLYI